MSFLCTSFYCNVLGIIIALCIGIITYFKWKYSYWKRKNIPFLTPKFWYGTMENPFSANEAIGVWFKQNYDELKKMGVKHGGIYNFATPAYFPIDPDYVKNILQNHFQYFMDRGVYYNEKADPMSANLFALEGQKWKNLRAKLSPTFTSGKMKMMFETLVACSNSLKSAIDELTEKKQKINIKELIACYTTDVIGSCAFGLECNSFKSPNAEFRKCGKKLLNVSTFDAIMQLICLSKPAIGYLFNVRLFSKSATDFLFEVVQDTVNYRIVNNVKRNDFLQLLTELKTTPGISKNGKLDNSLTIEEMAAQCLVFFVAGFEMSSSTVRYGLYELAKNQEIQQKVRDEINEVLSNHNNKITYGAMMDLKYMTQVLEETMRKYPSLPQLIRKCGKDYSVPNTDVIIEKGTSVFISILGLHYDPDHYPNPEQFDPERFSDQNKKKRHPFTFIPFGEGPRVCIGMRFGIMQMKVCLTVLLKNFIFSLNENTPNPITFNLRNFLLETKETIWLDSKPIHKSY